MAWAGAAVSAARGRAVVPQRHRETPASRSASSPPPRLRPAIQQGQLSHLNAITAAKSNKLRT